MAKEYRKTLSLFETILQPLSTFTHSDEDTVVDLPYFKSLCYHGIPDEPGIRPRAWKVLLEYLPLDKRLWSSSLKKGRDNYYSFVRELISNMPIEMSQHESGARSGQAHDRAWSTYLADNELIEQIDKDVRRTLPDMAFFQRPVAPSPFSPLTPTATGNVARSLNRLSYDEGVRATPEDEKAVSPEQPLNAKLPTHCPDTLEVDSMDRSAQGNQIDESNPSVRVLEPLPAIDASVSPQLYDSIPAKRNLFRRIAHLQPGLGIRTHREETSPSRDISKNPAGRNADPSFDSDHRISTESENGSDKAPTDDPSVHIDSNIDSDVIESEAGGDLHWEAVERILFLYAKLNPGIGYVQGMNELLGPVYYCLANDSDEEGRAHAEADSFHVFTKIMSRCHNHFLRSLDDDESLGIGASMRRVDELLKLVDEDLWTNLTNKELLPAYYSFRWLTTMCAREFDLASVLRVWDSVLAEDDFLIDFCVAMIVCLRNHLLISDYATSIKLLQQYPLSDDLRPLLSLAYEIHDRRTRKQTKPVRLQKIRRRNEAARTRFAQIFSSSSAPFDRDSGSPSTSEFQSADETRPENAETSSSFSTTSGSSAESENGRMENLEPEPKKSSDSGNYVYDSPGTANRRSFGMKFPMRGGKDRQPREPAEFGKVNKRGWIPWRRNSNSDRKETLI